METGDAGSIFARDEREPTHEYPQSIFESRSEE